MPTPARHVAALDDSSWRQEQAAQSRQRIIQAGRDLFREHEIRPYHDRRNRQRRDDLGRIPQQAHRAASGLVRRFRSDEEDIRLWDRLEIRAVVAEPPAGDYKLSGAVLYRTAHAGRRRWLRALYERAAPAVRSGPLAKPETSTIGQPRLAERSAIGRRAGSRVTAVPCGQVGSSIDRALRGRPLPAHERRGKP